MRTRRNRVSVRSPWRRGLRRWRASATRKRFPYRKRTGVRDDLSGGAESTRGRPDRGRPRAPEPEWIENRLFRFVGHFVIRVQPSGNGTFVRTGPCARIYSGRGRPDWKLIETEPRRVRTYVRTNGKYLRARRNKKKKTIVRARVPLLPFSRTRDYIFFDIPIGYRCVCVCVGGEERANIA